MNWVGMPGVSSGCRANCEESGERVDSACEKGEGVMSSKPIQQGSLVLLWAGEDPAVHAALLEELGVAEIPFSDKSLGDVEVAVLSSNLAAAQEVLEKLLEEEPADLEIPAQDGVAGAELPLTVETETYPKVEVWNGNNDRIAQFLTAAMQENEIPIHLENPGEETRIFVSAANEKRAREIVREVVEGAPPE